MLTHWKHTAPSLVTVPNLVILGQVRAVAKGRPPADIFFLYSAGWRTFSADFRLAAFFSGGFSASDFFRRIRLKFGGSRAGTTTKGYFTTKTPCGLVGHIEELHDTRFLGGSIFSRRHIGCIGCSSTLLIIFIARGPWLQTYNGRSMVFESVNLISQGFKYFFC